MLHLLEIVRSDLMSAPAGSAVDGDRYATFLQTVGLGCPFVEHVVHYIEFEEVVAGSQGSEFGESSLSGLLSDPCLVGILHVSPFLRHLQVLLPSVSVLHGPFGSDVQYLGEVLLSHFGQSFGSESRRDVAVELVHEVLDLPVDVLEGQVSFYKADAAVYVETYPSGGDGPLIGIHGGDSADGESISPMDVRHGHGVSDDPGQTCYVGGLLRRVVVQNVADEPVVGIDHGIGPHSGELIPGYEPPVVIHLLELSVPYHDVHRF